VVHLPPKEAAALEFLAHSAGQIVTPLQLKHALWGEVHVTADSVPKCISSLRAKLEPEDCIQTVYKRGYRFTAAVQRNGAAPVLLPRLAIMPFATEYSIPEHLGPAIAEETMARLGSLQRPVASVLARDSVFVLARLKHTAQKIGEILNADLVLTGTLRALGAHYRLRAEMVRVADGAQVWVEDLVVCNSCMVAMEDELVQRLLTRLNAGGLVVFAAREPGMEPAQTLQQRQAYEIFLHAHAEWQSLQRHRMQDSLRNLTRAVELDPTLFAAKVDIVRLCVAQSFHGFMPPKLAADQIRRTAQSIPGFPRGAEAILPVLAWVNFYVDHDLAAAFETLSLGADLPNDPWTTRLLIMFDLSRHRFDEAIAQLNAEILKDPYAIWLHARLAWALHLAGRGAESVEQIRRAFTLFPNSEVIAFLGATILTFNGDAVRGLQLAESFVQHEPYFDLATSVHAYVLACAGRNDEARAILERLQWLSRERFVISSFTPAAYVALGDHRAALRDLRAAKEARCPWFFQILADPCLAPLHGQPEFEELASILPRMEARLEDVDLESVSLEA
jgi:TolB-like protein/tetratricopeptide (TPR) repeat protein